MIALFEPDPPTMTYARQTVVERITTHQRSLKSGTPSQDILNRIRTQVSWFKKGEKWDDHSTMVKYASWLRNDLPDDSELYCSWLESLTSEDPNDDQPLADVVAPKDPGDVVGEQSIEKEPSAKRSRLNVDGDWGDVEVSVFQNTIKDLIHLAQRKLDSLTPLAPGTNVAGVELRNFCISLSAQHNCFRDLSRYTPRP